MHSALASKTQRCWVSPPALSSQQYPEALSKVLPNVRRYSSRFTIMASSQYIIPKSEPPQGLPFWVGSMLGDKLSKEEDTTMKKQQHHESSPESEDNEDLNSLSPFLRSSSSANAHRRPRRTSSSGVLQENGSESGPPHLFTPAGDTLPPIATSRSTTALLAKKKQLHQLQQQSHLNISNIHPWMGPSSGSTSSPLPPPPPNHPPPPYSVACPERPGNGLPQVHESGLSGTNGHGRTSSHSRNRSSSQVASKLTLASRNPVYLSAETGHDLDAQPDAFINGTSARFNGPDPSGTPSSSVIHSHTQSRNQSTSQILTSPPILSRSSARTSSAVLRSSDSTPSSASEDSDVSIRGEESAIYTSPPRKRKGKERVIEEVGLSTSVHLHEGNLYDRLSRAQVYDEHSPNQVIPKSCLKPTPSSSSTSLATSDIGGSPSITENHTKSNIGVRFVRFTLGLSGSKNSKGKEREREPRLICTTPGEACAGETETETDEPSQRRLPTSRRPPSRLSSSFGFGPWRGAAPNGQPPPPSPPPPPPSPPPPQLTQIRAHAQESPLRSSLSSGVSGRSTAGPPGSPLPESTGNSKFTSFLFQAFRLLSIVPAFCGVMFCVLMLVGLGGVGSASEKEKAKDHVDKYWKCVSVQSDAAGGVYYGDRMLCDEGRGVLRGPPVPGRVDWVVAAFWALLTAHHCLGLSTGLLARWKLYYTPSSTLVRLLALQGICWPATHLTLSVVGGGRRPVAAWAVIGTCTAVSRSVQIWVTSNIVRNTSSRTAGTDYGEVVDEGVAGADGMGAEGGAKSGAMTRFVHALAAVIGGGNPQEEEEKEGGRDEEVQLAVSGVEVSEAESTFDETRRKRGMKRNKERWWDWKEVGLKCMLPTGMAYFLMAWAEVGRREWGGWYHSPTAMPVVS